MFQAAKANKELSQALLHQNPSFNLNIPDHDLQQYLSPSKHIPPPLISPITRAPSLPEQEEEEEEDSGNELAVSTFISLYPLSYSLLKNDLELKTSDMDF